MKNKIDISDECLYILIVLYFIPRILYFQAQFPTHITFLYIIIYELLKKILIRKFNILPSTFKRWMNLFVIFILAKYNSTFFIRLHHHALQLDVGIHFHPFFNFFYVQFSAIIFFVHFNFTKLFFTIFNYLNISLRWT